MIVIDNILELANVFEPGRAKGTKPLFSLSSNEDGKWNAKVQMKFYWLDENGDSPEEAMQKLEKALISLNEQVQETILQRLKRILTGNKPKLKIVEKETNGSTRT